MSSVERASGAPTSAAAARPPRPALSRALGAVIGLHLGLLLVSSVVVPAFRAPDEHLHVDRVLALAPGTLGPPGAPGTPGTPGTPGSAGEGSVSAAVLAARETSPVYRAQSPPVATAEAVPPGERPTFAALAAEGTTTDVANQVAEHPPLAHAIGATALTVASWLPGWPWPFDRVVALLRLVDLAIVAAVPILAWATARRLGCPPRASLTAAVLVLAVPQLTHVGAAVNNDGLLVALAGVLFLLGARVITGDDSSRTAVLTGAALGAALLTSGLAVVFVPWAAAAYLLAGAGQRGAATGPRLATVAGVATVTGGWWWVRELLVDGHLPLGLTASQVAPAADGPLALPRALATLVTSFWGGFGWLEASLPAAAVIVASMVVAGGVGVAFWRGRVGAVRARLALFVFPTAALAVLVAGAAVVSSLGDSGAFVFQGRYLLPGLVGLVVVVAVGLDQLGRRPVPALPLLVLVGALAMQALAVAAVVGRYWAGSVGERFRAVLAFSPWPPVLAFFAAVGLLALVVWALVEVGRAVRTTLPPPPPAPRPPPPPPASPPASRRPAPAS